MYRADLKSWSHGTGIASMHLTYFTIL